MVRKFLISGRLQKSAFSLELRVQPVSPSRMLRTSIHKLIHMRSSRRRSLSFALMVLLVAIAPTCASPPPVEGVSGEPFRVATDSIPRAQIAGTLLRAPGGKAKGTVFMCHGFHRSSWDFRGYDWVATQEGWNVVRFDFRQHGNSSHAALRAPTLGYYEIWDLKAVID